MKLQKVARAALLGFVLLAAAAISSHILFGQGPYAKAVDFGVFERAARDPVVYRDDPAPFAYPPSALVLMAPLVALGYWFWIGASAVLFGISAYALSGRKAGLSFVSPAACKGLVHGQSAMLLAGLVFLGLSVPPLVGGILWGIAAAVKPQLMLFAPLALLVRRDWQMLSGMGLGGAAMIIASLALFDTSLWMEWPKALFKFSGLVERGEMVRAITPAGVALVSGLPGLPFVAAGLVMGTVAVAVSAAKVEGVHLVGLITAAGLVASPYAHIYDAVALIPAAVALLLTGRLIYAVPAGLIFIGSPMMSAFALWLILLLVLAENVHSGIFSTVCRQIRTKFRSRAAVSTRTATDCCE